MKLPPVQDVNSNAGAIFGLAMLCGAVLGLGSALMFFLPNVLGGFTDWSAPYLADTLGLLLLAVGYGVLIGLASAIAPAVGTLVALRLAATNVPIASWRRQILVTGLGALIGGLVTAFGLTLLFFGTIDTPGAYLSLLVIMLVCAVLAMLVVFLILYRSAHRNAHMSVHTVPTELNEA